MVLEVTGLVQTLQVFRGQFLQNIPGGQEKRTVAAVCLGHLPFKFAGACLGVKKNVNRAPEEGKEEDKEDPGHFIGGFFFLVKNVDTNHNAECLQNIIRIAEGKVRTGYYKKDKYQLDKDEGDDQYTPSENEPDPIFFHLILWPGLRCICLYTGQGPAPCRST